MKFDTSFFKFLALLVLIIPFLTFSEEKSKIVRVNQQINQSEQQQVQNKDTVICATKEDNGELTASLDNESQEENTCLFVGCNGFF